MRTKKKAVTKKRNPQDATNRNVRAANKKIANLEDCVGYLQHAVVALTFEADSLESRIKALETKSRKKQC